MIADPVVLVVDVQKDFAKPGYAFGDRVDHLDEMLQRTGAFLDRYRASGRTPILIQTIHDDDVDSPSWIQKYDDEDNDRPCLRGTEGVEFAPELNATEDDVVVTKHRYDAFHNTDLEQYLTANDISEVLVCGIATNVCVASTVRGAFDRDYDVTVLSDCVGSADDDLHEAALQNMDKFFGGAKPSTEISLPDLEPKQTA